ncbi:hypothetical protein NDU88_007172 [Pleurodeles waltl]|uniref:Uncharacterized protein n=1 Tax=Pleurodeles waltl TaxID=8319 RepID=A0AAV7VTN6_PLEWA|nr:hypothetical protein NDU88_007172 [Pleurodeles waltl]
MQRWGRGKDLLPEAGLVGLEAATWAERAAAGPRADESVETLGGAPGAGAAPPGEQVSHAAVDERLGGWVPRGRGVRSEWPGGAGCGAGRKLDSPAPSSGSCWCPLPPLKFAEREEEL